jgi:hypothetical protein
MSRQLKFRTWDKNRQSFIGPINLLGDQKYVVLPENWPWENYCDVINLSISATTLEEATKQRNEYARKNWIVQQFTGLFDSQGKEIYEGDIMLYPNGLPYIVKFGEYSHCDLMTVKLNGWHITNQGWEWPLDSVGKVVGNVFETPELLK